MGHGLGSDTDSDLSSAPPSPRLAPSPVPLAPSSLPPPSPPQPRERSLSSVTEPPWKTRPRPKRQPSTSVPNQPSSPKRRKRGEVKGKDEKGKEKDVSGKENEVVGKGEDVAGKGKEATGAKKKPSAKAGRKPKDPSPAAEPTETEEQASTSTLKVAAPAPWKKTAKPKVSPTPPTEPVPPEPAPATSKAKPPPFAKAKPAITSKPPFNTSKSVTPDPSKPAIKPLPSSAVKASPSSAKPSRTTKRPVYNESTESSGEEQEEKPKRHKRRKSHVQATPKATRKSRPSLPAHPTPKAKAKSKLEPSEPLELRPASFLTKTSSFLTKPIVQSTSFSLQPREDVWSYDDLTGLTWVKLGVPNCEIIPGNEEAGVLGKQWCWWPAEVKQNTSNGLKLALCGLGIERELTPHATNETNVLTFRKPNSSSPRFPTFKPAFSSTAKDVEPQPTSGEPPTEPPSQPNRETPNLSNDLPILPTSPSDLETAWKQALACAFKIDTESNDGLEDIYLLFSQKSKTPKEDDESSGNTALEEQDEEEEHEEDILDNGTTVLCRYRTRYYPAKIVSYHPREGKSKRRHGYKGRYKCIFADESTRLAPRFEIMTTLDDGFATCSLGAYQRYMAQTHEKPSGVREPSPAPRGHSPAPESQDCEIDPKEYCSRERMRDQLKPVLPFLKGLIERKYIPGRGVVESPSKPAAKDDSSAQEGNSSSSNNASTNDSDQTTKEAPEPVLDRHAVFMQGGRARKNLAYSVHTGDLNEDDCEELMFEISRWALRGERWACGEGTDQGSGGGTNQEGGMKGVTQEGGGGGDASQEGQSQTGTEVEGATGNGSSPQRSQENEGAGASSTEVSVNGEDVEMEDASQETNVSTTTATGQDSQLEAKSGDTTEIEDEPLTVVKTLEQKPSTAGDFRSLVRLQPPRPVGAPDYEGLTPEERMGYVSDVLYPEAAALILSYRRGIRTQPGPLADPAAEYTLYTAGLQAAKNTSSTFDWVEQILAVRQLRESNSKYQVEEQTQVVVAGGTKSRPRYMTSVLK